MKTKKKILIAIAWEKDKTAAINSLINKSGASIGPIAATAQSSDYQFDSICVVNTNSQTHFAKKDDFDSDPPQISFDSYIRCLKEFIGKNIDVSSFKFESNNERKLSDYSFLHNQLRDKVFNDIKKKYPHSEWFILMNSGPTEAQFLWPLLAGPVNASLLKSHTSRDVTKINIPFDIHYRVPTQKVSAPVEKTHRYLLNLHCDSMKNAVDYAKRIAPLPNSVLLLGESGTGKEMMARFIDTESKRKGPFVPVDCTGLPEKLIESLLFGYDKGTHSEADTDKEGMIEYAHNGTLFLDEIGDMPLSQQAKLLRVLNDKVVRRIGSTQEKQVDFRLICATNKNLAEEVELKNFREDLFFRIDGLNIHLIPLRDRGEKDIDSIAEFHLKIAEDEIREANEINSLLPIPDNIHLTISDEAKKILYTHSWPGNARELAAVIKRAASHCVIRGNDFIINIDDIENSMSTHIRRTSSLRPNTIELKIDTNEQIHIDEILSEVESIYYDKYYKAANNTLKIAAENLGFDHYQSMKNRWNKAKEKLEDYKRKRLEKCESNKTKLDQSE